MLPKLKNVLELLERLAPTRLAQPWDNTGFQVGSYSQEISKILVALDPVLRNVRSAHGSQSQLLLTHHPLIFKPISRLNINSFPGNVIFEAAKTGVSIVAAHTNLDVARGGINDILADLLGLKHVEILEDMHGEEGVGLGRIGDLPESTNLSAVLKKIKTILKTENLKVIDREDDHIRRLAVVGGAGGSLVPLAAEKGADLLLTGDISHHHALEAESSGIVLIDGGHFRTEKTAFKVFAGQFRDLIRAEGWEVGVEVEEDETDPMNDV